MRRAPGSLPLGEQHIPILDDRLATGTGYLVGKVQTDPAAFVRRDTQPYPRVRMQDNLDPGIVVCPEPKRIYGASDRLFGLAEGRRQCVRGTGCSFAVAPG